MNALLHRQEETDAKLEALTMDVHHMRGEMTAMKQEIHALNEKLTPTMNNSTSVLTTSNLTSISPSTKQR